MTKHRTFKVEVVTRETWLGTVPASSRKQAEQAARDAYNQEALIQIDAKFIRVAVEEVRS